VNVEPTKTNNLDQQRRIELTQLRFIDKKRLRGKQGALNNKDKNLHRNLIRALQVIFFL